MLIIRHKTNPNQNSPSVVQQQLFWQYPQQNQKIATLCLAQHLDLAKTIPYKNELFSKF